MMHGKVTGTLRVWCGAGLELVCEAAIARESCENSVGWGGEVWGVGWSGGGGLVVGD